MPIEVVGVSASRVIAESGGLVRIR